MVSGHCFHKLPVLNVWTWKGELVFIQSSCNCFVMHPSIITELSVSKTLAKVSIEILS